MRSECRKRKRPSWRKVDRKLASKQSNSSQRLSTRGVLRRTRKIIIISLLLAVHTSNRGASARSYCDSSLCSTMPSLVICGHPTFLAGDDLRTYTLCAVALRLVQVVALIAFTVITAGHFYIENPPGGCKGNVLVEHSAAIFIPYIALSFFLVLVGLGLEIGIYRTTGKGTPTQPEKRSQLKPLCRVKMIPMTFLRATVLALAVLAVLFVRALCRCDICPRLAYQQWNGWFSILVITHLIESFAVCMYATYFGCKARPSLPVKVPPVSVETKWRICCRCCCTVSSIITCCLAGGRDSQASADFTDIAIILADYFDGRGIVDVVLSDIVVGFRMLAREQKQRELVSRNELMLGSSIVQSKMKLSSNDERGDKIDEKFGEKRTCFHTEVVEIEEEKTKITGDDEYQRTAGLRLLSRKDASDKYVIAKGAHFMRYAEGVYSFQPHTYPGKRMVKACHKMMEDTVDSVTERRLLSACNLRPELTEIVYAQFMQGLAKTPYGIFVDHAWKSIVVSIRGTQSLDDVVADLTMTPTSMEEWGARCGFDARDCFVHAGILKCAEWIYNDLERHGWLDKLLSEKSSHVDGYRLVLTGHSLGAGCAAVLSFMLKGKFPGLRCLAFSPPGCTMSLRMAETCEAYLTSYILDTDIVPRLSLASMEHLRNDVLEMIARIKVTKYEAMHAEQDASEVFRLLHQKEDTPSSKFKDQLDRFSEHLATKRGQRKELHILLYPPGRIVHLVKTEEDEEPSQCCSCCSKADTNVQVVLPYAAKWAHRDDFAEVFISSHFLDDHKTANVLKELERVAGFFGLSWPYTCESSS